MSGECYTDWLPLFAICCVPFNLAEKKRLVLSLKFSHLNHLRAVLNRDATNQQPFWEVLAAFLSHLATPTAGCIPRLAVFTDVVNEKLFIVSL